LEWRRRGAYRNGEACGMDLNLAPGKETEGAREGRVRGCLARLLFSTFVLFDKKFSILD
jgi:hypothetical protein